MGNQLENVRSVQVITGEIQEICAQARRMMLVYSAEIGRRLVEVKEMLPHGEWGNYLKSEVGFSQRTAQNHIKIFEMFGSPQMSIFGAELKSQAFANLSYSQALQLFAIPSDEVEDFIIENDIEHKTSRQIKELIAERDSAKERAEQLAANLVNLNAEAEANNANAQRKIAELTEKLENAKSENIDNDNKLERIMILEAELKNLKADYADKESEIKELQEELSTPKEVEIPKEKILEITNSVAADLKKEAEGNKERIAELEAALEAEKAKVANAVTTADPQAEQKIAELERKLLLSEPEYTRFKYMFEQAQDTLDNLLIEYEDAPEDLKDKFKIAIKQLLEGKLDELI